METKQWRTQKRNTPGLFILIFAAVVYCTLLYINLPITNNWKLDGIIGVLLGLYAASLPAANVLDLLFFARAEMRRGLSRQAYTLWWGLNALVLLAGWATIVFGLIRFTTR
jgi:hypothetical protein